MTITYVCKIKGYGAPLQKARYSEVAWKACKDMFWLDPTICEGLKYYHRSSQSLLSLYEMIGFYDRKYAPSLRGDPLFEDVFAKVKQDFTFTNEKIPMRHVNDITHSMMTLNTSPGYPYVQQGYSKKWQVFDQAKKNARYLGHRIKEDLPVRFPYTMIFGRTAITTKDKNKLRGVWGKPFDALILEASIFLPYLEKFKTAITPNGYRYTVYHRGYRQLYDELCDVVGHGENLIVETDFSKYDTSLAPWLIRTGHSVHTDQIDFSKYEHRGQPNPVRSMRLSNRLLRETIDTMFIMPDGHVFQKHGGTDSGSLVFQRDEDVCTSIIVNYAAKKMGREVLFYRVLGDDSLMVLRGTQKLDMDEFSRIIKEDFGIEVNTQKSSQTLNPNEAKFLGHKLCYGLPTRDTADVILSTVYPKATDQSDFDVAQRVVALMYDNCFQNPCVQKYLELVWSRLDPLVVKHCYEGTYEWHPRWKKMFKLMGLDTPPRCTPPPLATIQWLLWSPPGSIKPDLEFSIPTSSVEFLRFSLL